MERVPALRRPTFPRESYPSCAALQQEQLAGSQAFLSRKTGLSLPETWFRNGSRNIYK